MDFALGIMAAAPAAPQNALDGFVDARAWIDALGALDASMRAAHLIGQCAHESAGFRRLTESLFYSDGERVFAVFGRRHFRSRGHAALFARNPERLANHVYADRMGNGPPASGDGYRYRGRGYLQLTGRANYRNFGRRIGIDLEAGPNRAEDPATAWLIAASYLASRRRAGRTALEWADRDNVEMVTRIVNGGLHGLAERRHLTALAHRALAVTGAEPVLARGDEGGHVLRLQHLLAAAGYSPGALDGDFGPRTHRALIAYQRSAGLTADGHAGHATWATLHSGLRAAA